MTRSTFTPENLLIITKIINNDDLSQTSKFYEIERFGFMVFQGSLGNTKRDALYVHKFETEIKVQLESGFGKANYARYVYFNTK